MLVTFAFSPCPNDTFMFEPIVNKRVDTRGLEFEIILDEVEQLNQAAFANKYDITKLSFNAFSCVVDRYALLRSGSALGRGCGPLIVSKDDITLEELKDHTVAIPGDNTTANLLMEIALPHVRQKRTIVFSEIEEAILRGEVDAGLLIHESRFTYESKGLFKIIDLGEYWEDTTGKPIPLGGIAMKRDIHESVQEKVDAVLSDSIAYAFAYPKSGIEYIKDHAQEMDEEVMYKHIDLYVNEYSQRLGEEGEGSIHYLFEKLNALGKISQFPEHLFVPA